MRTLRNLLAAVLVLAALPAAASPSRGSSRAEAELPGGRANFVVATAHLKPGIRDSWMRLGTYRFNAADSTVRAEMRLWRQSRPSERVNAGVTPDLKCAPGGVWDTAARRNCPVKTVAGFRDGATDKRSGVYELRDQTVHGRAARVLWIKWSVGASAWTEQWEVLSRPTLTRLDQLYSTRANAGYGYGSKAELTSRRAMDSVRQHDGEIRLEGMSWRNKGAAAHHSPRASGSVFSHSKFTRCDNPSYCMTLREAAGSRNVCGGTGCPHHGWDGDRKIDITIQYYLARIGAHDRRDTLWHWCSCLAMEHRQTCHSGNSHVKPMLQVLDDNGKFRGWVGVETSFYPGRNTKAHREQDMLGVFRMTDWV